MGSASRGYVALSSAIWHRLSGSTHPESQTRVQSRFCPRRFRFQRASKPILVPGIPWIHESGTCDGTHRLSLSLSPRRRFSSLMSALDAGRLCHCGRTARALGADIMEPSGTSTPRRVKGAYSTFFSRSDKQTFTRLAATNELNHRNRKRSTEAADGTGLLPTASKATLCFFQGTVTQTVNFKPSKTAALRRYLGLAARMRKQRRSLPR